ncbi:MAG: TIGR00282 family metallophosphoesterase [Ruminiclostridium sp.]|nr:TIGR00282 family metallophosphoesterase [Ruminiclostridium sp.]MDE6725814.1 TIGR00282 family metallophosphoesterase [Ruminiclostridium sp.]
MNILFVGDIVGQNACRDFTAILPGLKQKYGIDVTIVNGENSADGNGITPYSADLMLSGGADAVTTGNHCFRRAEMNSLYEESSVIIRPANYGDECPGKGYTILDFGSYSLAVVNLIGTTFMQAVDNPFHCIDKILKEIDTKNILVDFHSETTSEKKALGYYLAGRVSAVVGTHTHVQTADECILENHTGYITDVGMTGVHESVLGIDKDIIIARLTTYYPQRHIYAKGRTTVNAVALEIDQRSGVCRSIKRIFE